MSITKEEFFEDFDELMRKNELIPRHLLSRLRSYNINGQNVGPEDIVRIMQGIREGDREQINRWRDVEEYFNRTLRIMRRNIEDSRVLGEYIYGGHELDIDVYQIERSMEYIIRRLLTVFDMNPYQFAEFFGLMTPGQQMGLASLERQGTRIAAATATTPERRNNLPTEIYRDVIGPYVGKKPTGGRYRSKKMKSMRRKNKKLRRKRTKKIDCKYNGKNTKRFF
jgi:hypothetical protein